MKPENSKDALFRIISPLVDDILLMSDEELLAEIHSDQDNVLLRATQVDNAITRAERALGKQRLSDARRLLDDTKRVRNRRPLISLAFPQKEEILRRFAAKDQPLKQKLTIAARNGNEICEAELDNILLDLIELGAIDGEGNSS